MGVRVGVALCLILLTITPLFQAAVGHTDHGEAEPRVVIDGVVGHSSSPIDAKSVRVDERPGAVVPGDLTFRDERGVAVTLGALIDRPTLILPVYYHCPQTCGMMLGNLAAALNKVPLNLGNDYRVIALSIDEEDTPQTAMRARETYTKILTKPLPDGAWHFLSGESATIRRFADATGFSFIKTGKHAIAHPNVLFVLSHDRVMIRYLYGPAFLPFDMGMALTEAAKGTPSLAIRKLVSYCFTYEPEKKTYTFSAVRVIVLAVLAVMGVALVILLRRKNT